MLAGRLDGLLPLNPASSLVVTRVVVGRSRALMLCLNWWDVLEGTPRCCVECVTEMSLKRVVLSRTPPALVAILLHRLFTMLVTLRTCELCPLLGELATSRLLMSRLRLPLLSAASPLFLIV